MAILQKVTLLAWLVSAIAVGEAADCGDNNPCYSGMPDSDYYFPHADPTKFVQCSEFGTCYIMDCRAGQVFSDEVNGCIVNQYPTGQVTGQCNNDSCVHGSCNGGKCACDAGWEGTDCGTLIDLCNPDPCEHGTCMSHDGTCVCDAGWRGTVCGTPTCNPDTCKTHGKCVNEICECTPGWKDLNCNTVSGETFDCEDHKPCSASDTFFDFHFPHHDKTKLVICFRRTCAVQNCFLGTEFNDKINVCDWPQ